MFKSDIADRKRQSHATRAECCADSACESGVRNQYFVGKRLTPDALRVEQRYLIDRRHLLNRAVIGWGVVHGYPVKPAAPAKTEALGPAGRLSIGPGLALDAVGRELIQVHGIELRFADTILLDAHGRLADPCKAQPQGCWLLRAHYAERDLGPTTVADPCGCAPQAWDQICETVRYSLSPIDCEHCCAPPDCDLQCACGVSAFCREDSDDSDDSEHSAERDPQDAAREDEPTRSSVRERGSRCLCNYLSNLDCEPDCTRLCVIDEPCAPVRVDLDHGVPLACVKLEIDGCGNWIFADDIEACGPRRLVKRNDALFDLIRGCDLTRISRIGWARWHRTREPVPWEDFSRSFGDKGPAGAYVTADYWVEFSRPVRAETVRADCFAMTILVPEDEGGWLTPMRVPIIGVDTNKGAPGVLAGHVTRATMVVDADWVDDAVRARRTVFADDATSVEIEVLGDYILDCNGQAVDANAVGLSPAPTGNGVPGDCFVSKFSVEARAQPARAPDAKPNSEGV